MVRTETVLGSDELRELLSLEEGELLYHDHETHDGAWRWEQAINMWRFWEHPGINE